MKVIEAIALGGLLIEAAKFLKELLNDAQRLQNEERRRIRVFYTTVERAIMVTKEHMEASGLVDLRNSQYDPNIQEIENNRDLYFSQSVVSSWEAVWDYYDLLRDFEYRDLLMFYVSKKVEFYTDAVQFRNDKLRMQDVPTLIEVNNLLNQARNSFSRNRFLD